MFGINKIAAKIYNRLGANLNFSIVLDVKSEESGERRRSRRAEEARKGLQKSSFKFYH
jgi:hypothetical protein